MSRSASLRSIIALATALMLCAAFCVWAGAENFMRFVPRHVLSKSGARIVAVPAEVDFQTETQQSSATVEVVLRNEGRAAAKLLEVTASCGCTVPKTPSISVLQPGAEVRMSIALQPPPYGRKDSVITLRTDALETETVRIPIHMSGRMLTPPYISMVPSELRVESVIGTTPAPQKFVVNAIEAGGEQWLKGFDVSNNDISVGKPNLVRELALDESTIHREYETEITFASSSANEAVSTILLTPITDSDPTKPSPRVTVHWRQAAALRAVPSSILITFHDANPKPSPRVILVAADDVAWKIESAECDVPWLSVSIEDLELKPGRQSIQIVADKPLEWDGEILQGRIRIRTNHPTCSEVVIRITARGQRQ